MKKCTFFVGNLLVSAPASVGLLSEITFRKILNFSSGLIVPQNRATLNTDCVLNINRHKYCSIVGLALNLKVHPIRLCLAIIVV